MLAVASEEAGCRNIVATVAAALDRVARLAAPLEVLEEWQHLVSPVAVLYLGRHPFAPLLCAHISSMLQMI